jgi:hypothetical protein
MVIAGWTKSMCCKLTVKKTFNIRIGHHFVDQKRTEFSGIVLNDRRKSRKAIVNDSIKTTTESSSSSEKAADWKW